MTIESLTYMNSLGESLVFSHQSVYCPQDVGGLSDVRNTIYSINSMGQDGDTFVSNRIEARDIDISGYISERDPGKMRDAKRRLARVLNPQLSATLTYQYGSFVRVISCRAVNAPTVSRSAGTIYTKFDVQLTCLNPYWREQAESRDDIAAWVGGLEFPVNIPEEGMEIGYRQPSLIVNVYNAGDVATRIRAVFTAQDRVVNHCIINVDTGESIRFLFTMEEGDSLTISTGYGEKSAVVSNADGTCLTI